MAEARWPAGTPIAPSGRGPGGGRFRAGPGGMPEPAGWAERLAAAAAARAGHAVGGLMTHDEVKAYLGRQDYTVVGSAKGEQGKVEFRQYPDGTKLAYKYTHRNITREDGSTLVSWEHAVRAEEQSSIVAHAIGAPVPAAVRDPQDRHGLLMQYIEGDDSGDQRERLVATVLSRDTPGGHMLGLLDILVGNHDRHSGNVILRDVAQRDVVGIDQGAALITDRWGGPLPDLFLFDLASEYGAGHVVDYQGNQIYYSREAIREARRRIERVSDQLDDVVWAGVQDTLDELESVSPFAGHDLGE